MHEDYFSYDYSHAHYDYAAHQAALEPHIDPMAYMPVPAELGVVFDTTADNMGAGYANMAVAQALSHHNAIVATLEEVNNARAASGGYVGVLRADGWCYCTQAEYDRMSPAQQDAYASATARYYRRRDAELKARAT